MNGERLTRRRFIAISACAGIAGIGGTSAVHAISWQGRALGADCRIEIAGGADGHDEDARRALAAARDTLRRMEALFSIYDPASEISLFNCTGRLEMSPEFGRLRQIVSRMHERTGGLFDPAVQGRFAARMRNEPEPPSSTLWRDLRVEGRTLLAPPEGATITFNGIAQGFACDRIGQTLAAHGIHDVLIDAGEFSASGRTRRLGISNGRDLIGHHALRDAAAATSTHDAFLFPDGGGHLLHPVTGDASPPYWQTVSVVAEDAATADAASTALALTSGRDEIEALAAACKLFRVVAQDRHGEVFSIDL